MDYSIDSLCPDGNFTTRNIQKAIDQVSAAGGGILRFGAQRYVFGTVALKTGVVLYLEPGAVLQGSGDIADYPVLGPSHNPQSEERNRRHFIYADGAENCGITGLGTIDGNGMTFWDPPSTCEFYTAKADRPTQMIDLSHCKNVVIQDVTLKGSPGWTIHIYQCSTVRIRGVVIDNSLIGPNTDGIDITDSADVFVNQCAISTGDDAIVIKSLGGVCERIVVSDCTTRTRCSALKLGANESMGTIRQVVMSNCVVYESSRGISLYNTTGGIFEDIKIQGCVIDCHNDMPFVCPVHISLSQHPKPQRDRGIGRIRRVILSDLIVRSDARMLFSAQDGAWLEDIQVSNVHLEFPVIENLFERAVLAERSLQFSPFAPEARGARSAVVAYNVKGLTLRDVTISWPENPEVAMHAIWAKHVRGGVIDCPAAKPSKEGIESIVLEDVDLVVRR